MKITKANNQHTLVIISVLVMGFCIPFLFIPVDNTYYSRSLRYLWNTGHIPLFAALSYILLHYIRQLREMRFEYSLGLLIFISFIAGGLIEALQFAISRNFSLSDLSLDLLGASIVPCLLPARKTIFKYSVVMCRICISAGLCLFIFPVARYYVDEYRATKDFPVLAGFKSGLELSRFGMSKRIKIINEELQVSFDTSLYSGFSLKYFPDNWEGYEGVRLDINNPNDFTLSLTCRIHDQFHNHFYTDRFNGQFVLEPGVQSVKIDLLIVKNSPRTREMDLSRVGSLGCFTTSLTSPVTISIREIALY